MNAVPYLVMVFVIPLVIALACLLYVVNVEGKEEALKHLEKHWHNLKPDDQEKIADMAERMAEKNKNKQ